MDVVISRKQLPAARAVLEIAGFSVLRDWLPAAQAFRHPDGRDVDLHPVTLTADGGGDQRLDPEPAFHYEPPTTGSIGGRVVRCATAETQLRAHVGYPITPRDRSDVLALARRFGLKLPDDYRDSGRPRSGCAGVS